MIDLQKLHTAMQAQLAEERERKLASGELVMCAYDCGRAIKAVDAHPLEYQGKTRLLCRRCCPRCDTHSR